MFFFFLPVGMNYRTARLPIVTLSLIGLNVLVYLLSLIGFWSEGGPAAPWILEHLWFTPADWHWYASLTSMFVHAGIFHLAGNMIFLFLFGCCVEDLIGRTRFAVFYLLGGLVAEMVYVALIPEHFASEIPMGGASGAISACMGMYLLLRANADIEFKYFVFFFIKFWVGEFSIPAWVVIPFWFLKNLLWAVLGLSVKLHSGTAFGAHVGGFLAGFAVIGLYKLVVKPPPADDEAEEAAPRPRMIIDPRRALAAARAAALAPTMPAEAPTIYLHDGSAQSGPFTLTQVRAMLRAGGIAPEASYWSEGLDDWQSVADLAEPGG